MTDDFYRQHERGHKGDGPCKMFKIFKKSLGSDPLPVVVNEDGQGTAYGDVELGCGRHETRDQSEKVAAQDEKTYCPNHGQVFFSLFADDIGQQAFKCLYDQLQDTLELRGDETAFAGGQP